MSKNQAQLKENKENQRPTGELLMMMETLMLMMTVVRLKENQEIKLTTGTLMVVMAMMITMIMVMLVM